MDLFFEACWDLLAVESVQLVVELGPNFVTFFALHHSISIFQILGHFLSDLCSGRLHSIAVSIREMGYRLLVHSIVVLLFHCFHTLCLNLLDIISHLRDFLLPIYHVLFNLLSHIICNTSQLLFLGLLFHIPLLQLIFLTIFNFCQVRIQELLLVGWTWLSFKVKLFVWSAGS